MKKKGFTLVELLAVIVILAILAGIAVPATTSISTTIRTNSYCTKIDNLLKDAESYYDDKVDDFTDTCYASVTVQDLVDSGYAKEDSTINPIDNTSLQDKIIIVYKKDSRLYAYWADETDSVYSNSCQTDAEKQAITSNRPTFDLANDKCIFANSTNQNVGSSVIIKWNPVSSNPRGSAYFNLSLNAVVTSTSAVASAKYCITTDENCTPDKTVDTPSNSMSINLPANGGTPQKICMKATTVIGDLSNTVCSDLYKVDNSTIDFSWSVASGSSSLVNGWYRSLSLTGTTTGKVQSAKYCIKTNSSCMPDTSTTLHINTFNVDVSQNASAQTACASITDVYGYTTSPKCNTSVKVDSSAPTISWSVASSASGSNNWYRAVTLKANVSDSVSGVSSSQYCVTDKICKPDTNGSTSSYNVSLPNGSKLEACAIVTDNAGNSSGSICSGNYNVDNVGPAISSVTATPNNKTINVSVSASDATSGIDTYYYQLDSGNKTSSSTSTFNYTNASVGTHTVNVWVRDKAGNDSEKSSKTVTIEEDTAVKKISGGAEYRYRGYDVNNYIDIGDTVLWRIIGCINTTSKSGVTSVRLKLIRNNIYDSSKYCNSSTNCHWSNSLIEGTLNGVYYNKLSSAIKNLIEPVQYNVGEYSFNEASPNLADMQNKESTATWTGNVAMMTAVDYYYGFTDETIATRDFYSDQTWIFITDYEYVMTKGTTLVRKTESARSVGGKVTRTHAKLNGCQPTYSHSYRPVITIKDTAKIKSGTGTNKDPYKLSL